jgi:hypothetical protein
MSQAPPEISSVEYMDLTKEEAAPAEYDIQSTSVETWLRSLQVRGALKIRCWELGLGVGFSRVQKRNVAPSRHHPTSRAVT